MCPFVNDVLPQDGSWTLCEGLGITLRSWRSSMKYRRRGNEHIPSVLTQLAQTSKIAHIGTMCKPLLKQNGTSDGSNTFNRGGMRVLTCWAHFTGAVLRVGGEAPRVQQVRPAPLPVQQWGRRLVHAQQGAKETGQERVESLMEVVEKIMG